MNYDIVTISIKKFLVTWILWTLIFVLLFILGIKFQLKINVMLLFIGFILVFISGLVVSLQFSKKKTKFSLTENHLEFNNFIIQLINIEGYYINRETPIMTQIEFKDKDHVYKLTAAKYGKEGKAFESFIADLTKNIYQVNKTVKKMTFFDFHNKQYTFSKFFNPILIVIIAIIDIIYGYLIFMNKTNMNWKVIFLNVLLFSILSFYTKNMNTKKE